MDILGFDSVLGGFTETIESGRQKTIYVIISVISSEALNNHTGQWNYPQYWLIIYGITLNWALFKVYLKKITWISVSTCLHLVGRSVTTSTEVKAKSTCRLKLHSSVHVHDRVTVIRVFPLIVILNHKKTLTCDNVSWWVYQPKCANKWTWEQKLLNSTII